MSTARSDTVNSQWPRTRLDPVNELPSVSVVVLNFNGRRFLDRCLQSALALDYPADRLQIVLVDNGSLDGSVEHVRRRYPSVEVLALDANYGFAEGNNRGARGARNEWVAFLNNDMWFRPSWLRDLFSPLQSQPDLACITSKILSWDGSAIDFVGGGVNVEGHGFQIDHGLRASAHDQPRRVLAPCGGAMAIRRQLFLDLGGFDSDYFCFFEDTDLGWRLNLLGHDVWYTPTAAVFHALHATARRFPAFQLRVLYERNALFSIYKCLDDANLALALPASMLLMNERALRIARVDVRRFRLDPTAAALPDEGLSRLQETAEDGDGSEPLSALAKARQTLSGEGWAQVVLKGGRYLRHGVATQLRRPLMQDGSYMPNIAVSHQVALHEFAVSLGALNVKRQQLQSQRVRSDQELIPLLVEPLRPTWDDQSYVRFYQRLVEAAGLRRRFGENG